MCCLSRLLGVVVILATSPQARAELPAESVVPGEASTRSEDVDEAPAKSASDLPSESTLPTYAAALAPIETPVDDVDRDESAANETGLPESQSSGAAGAEAPPTQDLPNEQALPPAAPEAPAAAGDDGLAIRGSPDGIPWLRLNLPGHTAPLRAVTFSADGNRLCTAGDDKTLVVWAQAPARDGGARWGYERTVRWQVQRGTRGRIYALAASPSAVALAGEGAMGAAGEVLLINPQTGELAVTLNDLDRGHRQVVVALSFAPAAVANSLASLSMDGCLVRWNLTAEGLWRATRLSGPDQETWGDDPALVQRLLAGRIFAATAAVDDSKVVAPIYDRMANDRVVWRLEMYEGAGGDHRPLGDPNQAPHWDHVTALAVGGNGELLASADGGGYVYLWDLRSTPARQRVLARGQATSLAFDATGRRLVIGRNADALSDSPAVEVWNVSNFEAPQRLAAFATGGLVAACGISPDGNNVAWASGSRAFIRPVSGGVAQSLPPGASPPLRVAFPAERPFYRLGFAKATASVGSPAINHVFDTELLRLDRTNQAQDAAWLPVDWLSRDWTVREEGAVAGRRMTWLYQAGTRRARVPINEERHGRLQSAVWIPSRVANERPFAAAIGTSGGGIYLVRPADDGVAPIVRQFRGHTGSVVSLAVSRDLRYLASGSLDGTVCVWPLADVMGDESLVQRWGASLEVRGEALVASAVRPDGPVFFRGVREGDSLVELRYVDAAGEVRTVNQPAEMRAELESAPWETLMTFRFARGRAAPREFQIYPAWQQLVSLFAADDGEWAYWAPAGYYEASFEGHKLFGWQINRGLELLPDFFLAAQFRQQLERPVVMSRLLRRGNLEAAFRAARIEPPANSEDALVNAYRLKPEVEILSPRDGDSVRGAATVTARTSVDASERLVPPKAFANGVVAVSRRLVSQTIENGRRHATYEWDLRLPAEERVLVQVAAATESEVTDSASIVVHNEAPAPASPPRLFLLSVGVDGYQDTQIPKLSTAVKSTVDLLALMQNRAAKLYRMEAASLLENRATKPSWRLLTQDFASELARGVSPDDLLVVFLSGHGVQAPGEAGYQFITANARYADVLAGRYNDCLSMSDLSMFADVPCRKLVILNTCHGGAMDPVAHRELKSAVRALQDDLLLTLAASSGEQEAVEGRFARRLIEALEGAADGDGDGVVTFGETVAYVERMVAADSSRDAVRQTPSAGPKELLPYVTAPLSTGGAAVAQQSPAERSIAASGAAARNWRAEAR